MFSGRVWAGTILVLVKNLLFALIMATVIIPAQNTVIPQMLTNKSFGLL